MSSEPPRESTDLDELEGRIAELKEPVATDRTLALGMSLVFSMGLVVVSCVFLGYLAGNWLQRRFDSPLLGVVPLLLSLAMAAVGCWKLMRPLLKD